MYDRTGGPVRSGPVFALPDRTGPDLLLPDRTELRGCETVTHYKIHILYKFFRPKKSIFLKKMVQFSVNFSNFGANFFHTFFSRPKRPKNEQIADAEPFCQRFVINYSNKFIIVPVSSRGLKMGSFNSF